VTTPTSDRPIEAPPLPIAAIHVAVLTSFAIAQPIFDLIGRNGEFLAARGSTRLDVVFFALTLAFVPPLLLLAIETLTPRSARGLVHAIIVACLIGLIALQVLADAWAHGWFLVALAAAVGAGAALLYLRGAAARLVLTALAPVPLVFLGLFLFHSDATQLISAPETASAATPRATLTAPVVVVVFDELPLNSLLGRDRRVDPVRFPNFAALSRGSTWFVNSSTVSEGTLQGIPALLTGRYPRAGLLPLHDDHPDNLFTLLGGADLHVVETETHLCPPELCAESADSFGTRLGSLYADTSVVYLHQLLPDDLARGIPSVSNGWQDFWRNGIGSASPDKRFRGFLATLRPTRRPAVWYLHVLLPHSPWRYLPSGKAYEIPPAPGWSAAEVWTENQAAVDQYWQRHLLQLAFTDQLLGELVARLRATGLYQRSLVVITADEGLSFRAGEKRRPASGVNLPDIAYVPLFVKTPHQRRGRAIRAPVQSVDVLPTLAGALGVRIPWRVEGRDVLSPRGRRSNVVLYKDGGTRFVVPAAQLQRRRDHALNRQLELFGSNEPPATLFGMGRHRALLGRSVRALPLSANGPAVHLDYIDRTSSVVQVSGSVQDGIHDIAVAAAGRVVAVAPAAAGRFWVLVPSASLGELEPRIYSIEDDGALRRLRSSEP
jgi:sulfatase-like protein